MDVFFFGKAYSDSALTATARAVCASEGLVIGKKRVYMYTDEKDKEGILGE